MLPLAIPVPTPQGGDEGFPWEILIWLVIFVVLPAAGRLLKWIAERFGTGSGEQPSRESASERRRAVRKALAEMERQGEQSWRRMVEGDVEEEQEPPPPPPPPPRAVPKPPTLTIERAALPSAAVPPPSAPALGAELAELVPSVPSLGTPLSPMDDEWSKRGGGRTLGDLGRRPARSGRSSRQGALTRRAGGRRPNWRRAVVLSEIISSPLALRPPQDPGAGA